MLHTNFGAHLSSFPEGVMNNVLSVKFVTLPGNKVRLTAKFVSSFS